MNNNENEVPRYSPSLYSRNTVVMVWDKKGRFVSYEDYFELERRYDSLSGRYDDLALEYHQLKDDLYGALL